MNILAINGSPRRHWNTELILEHALQGAQSVGDTQSDLFHLYPMKYSGCIGCYGCKRKGHPSSQCHIKDSLTPLLEKAQEADVLLIATPVYFFGESAGTRAFMERLLYAWTAFNSNGYASRCPKPIYAGLLYTLAGTPESVQEHGHQHFAESTDLFFSLHFTRHERLFAYETLHTNDYDKFELDVFDSIARQKSRKERFPIDCEKAYALGASLALNAKGKK